MLALQNSEFILTCAENGQALTIIDARRWTRWALDYDTLVYGHNAGEEHQPKKPAAFKRLTPLSAQASADTLTLTFQARESRLEMVYQLFPWGIEVRLPVPADPQIGFAALPGSFRPEGEALKLLLPIMQGMLWDGRGGAFSALRAEASHLGFSMPFLGSLTENAGLLVAAQTRDDVNWWYGKDESGRYWATNLQISSLGEMRYERSVHIFSTEPSITAIAKRYRARVQGEGRFKNWDEKIAERPYLEHLFGTLMTFIGYCQDDIDYVAECRKLKAYGFDRALIYPGRFNMYKPDIHMGGRPAIDLERGQIEAIKELGYDVAPWSWLNEALIDGSERVPRMLRKDSSGAITKHWAIDDQQWYNVCSSFLVENQTYALDKIIPEMSWDHFDVLACVPGIECWAMDHSNHHGRPLSRGESKQWIREVFKLDHTANRIVSSENFNDSFSLEYDLGSVKAWPQYGNWPFWPVPLTMLVFHDSMIHSWWELHSYNNPWRGRTSAIGQFEYGGGRPKLMASLDALMGCPPDVLPFGAQYGYTGRGKETFLYQYRFEDPEVQIALREALPVAKLHRKIGKLEMVDFKILSEDGYVQESTFADGSRVVANFSRDFCGEVPGIDHTVVKGVEALAPESWIVIGK